MNIIGKVVLFDLDQTLCKEECWTPEDCLSATPNLKIIDKINKIYLRNFVVIYTARRDENIPATLKWLRKHNISFHAISNHKCSADIYIDDKAYRPEEI